MEDVGIFYGYFDYFPAISYISCSYGIFCGHLVHISPFWYFVSRKIWQPCRPCLYLRNDINIICTVFFIKVF
jgi:hypothetical protein